MEDLFHSTTAMATSRRVNKLREDTKPLWGKMNAAQMLAHLQVPMRVAMGEKKLKRTFVGLLFGRIAKKQVFSEKPFKQNLPTDPNFIMKGRHDFTIEKNRVLDLIDRFVIAGPSGITKDPHPFFGKLTETEWSTSMWKHFDHHLRQFGV